MFNSVRSKIILNSPKVFWNGKNIRKVRTRRERLVLWHLEAKFYNFLKNNSLLKRHVSWEETILRWLRAGLKFVTIGHNPQYKLIEHPFAQLSTKNPILGIVANGILNYNKPIVIIKHYIQSPIF